MSNIKLKNQYTSDIHLEFRENFLYLKTKPFEVMGDVLVLADDSFYMNNMIISNSLSWKLVCKTLRN